jgi:hypothetical protein
LFTVDTGDLTLKCLTIWHNSSSKGVIITASQGGGWIELLVCFLCSCYETFLRILLRI